MSSSFLTHALSTPELIYHSKKSTEDILFPSIHSFDEGFLFVSKVHQLYFSQYGNPEGFPVLFVHGGPGGGCSPQSARYFDPNFYRIILFDQRGSMQSKPFTELKENTTQDLIADIEKLREHLKISRWMIFGGSWGSALGVLYGQAFPERCSAFVLRGVFLGTQEENLQLWYGMKDTFPEEWDQLITHVPKDRRNDLIEFFHEQVNHSDPAIRLNFSQIFVRFDFIASFFLQAPALEDLQDQKLALSLARIFVHYSKNHFFIQDSQILDSVHRVSHIPAIIVHGRYDMILRVKSAYQLFKAWKHSQLSIIQDGGHAACEPGVASELVRATEKMKPWLSKQAPIEETVLLDA